MRLGISPAAQIYCSSFVLKVELISSDSCQFSFQDRFFICKSVSCTCELRLFSAREMGIHQIFDVERNSSFSNALLVQSRLPVYISDFDAINISTNDHIPFRALPQSGFCQYSFRISVSRSNVAYSPSIRELRTDQGLDDR